ncbi:common central domain of tyrosinase domain-containing protein [Trichoderma breve]|uniref:tyrosinase n=1 Tax=Trichoderma breve TaxID=2034170 RepID=A0A9W9E8A8_9HYPO|nr:common central domain of tyrosinase domain-containing protein [Trichoderma breve]KAJ4858276.1 common central domain of tyrosinase domain-containing protein [Trichoderma breve]
MRFLVCFGWVLSLFISLVSAQDYDFGVDVVSLTRRQDPNAPIVVSRLPLASNGSIPLRLEVRDMKADKRKWDLFILALSMFQSVSQDDPLSYYQVAGIHGVPFVTWNDVGPAAGASQSGYCPHSSVLFPTWHRPYLALYEQELFKLADAISRMFSNVTERLLYMQAASDFRIPYWDWASPAPPGQSHFPDVFWNSTMAQYGPNGVQVIRNPLYSYSFHPLDAEALIWPPLRSWNETKRAPNTDISELEPPSMNDQVNTALLAKLPEIQQRLYILFSSYHDHLDSIEAVHDIIHIYGGSRGHMTYVPLSSFDPLFFLHHAMTDRLISMWQLLNPTAWITPQVSGEATYTALKGTMQNSSTPLTPFMSSADGTFWDSDMSRTTEVFGYSYGDTSALPGDGENPRNKLIRKINKWIGMNSPAMIRIKSQAQHRRPSGLWKGSPEWIANVYVNHGALDGSFSIYLFAGQPPGDAGTWGIAPNLIGSVGIFTMSGMSGSHSKISGTVPLTIALMRLVDLGALQDTESSSVVPFLQQTLHFRIASIDNKEVDPEQVNGLYIGISSSRVRLPGSEVEFPQWGQPALRLTIWE